MTEPTGMSPVPPPVYPAPLYAAPPSYYATPTGAPPTNALAIISMVAGIAGIIAFPIVASIVAVVLGIMARKQILVSREGGTGMAMAGLVMGWIGLAFWGLLALLYIAILMIGITGFLLTG